LFLHYSRFCKVHVFHLLLSVVSATEVLINPPLGCRSHWNLLIPILIVIWCLSPYHPCRRFSRKDGL
jgi:hypothetical protein